MGITEVTQIAYGMYLAILSIMDIRVQRVPVLLVAVGGTAAAAVRICRQEVPLVLALGGAAIGVMFLVVSRGTREAFGYGDSLVILAMGLFLGFWNLLVVLTCAFLLSSLFAAASLLYKGMNKKVSYPFLPFLLISYCIWFWSGGS
ncbi:prepilin peptidase [Clostridium sp. C105KSO13]|uniref:prepilin peptidase n=1 Tax=Clostridium sp. C105KSO13 TaxID=1776045 RepID=UPI0007406904|nr:A24 family peptidase [Clostridium sp. C105KSO13]CUX37163.1 Type IV leader peptidase family protein [Clostridium sp. C105KSO13]